MNFTSFSGSTESNSTSVLAGGLILISVPAALLYYRRRKQ
ncbi:LPXTG cell wall anchor domain-containing protein [Methanosarcina sp. UBA5]|nr:LPXTG cell wall anchor domain-containing protein [Methanosarcina sp. UBA5]